MGTKRGRREVVKAAQISAVMAGHRWAGVLKGQQRIVGSMS